jgi:hypothetical protein
MRSVQLQDHQLIKQHSTSFPTNSQNKHFIHIFKKTQTAHNHQIKQKNGFLHLLTELTDQLNKSDYSGVLLAISEYHAW